MFRQSLHILSDFNVVESDCIRGTYFPRILKIVN